MGVIQSIRECTNRNNCQFPLTAHFWIWRNFYSSVRFYFKSRFVVLSSMSTVLDDGDLVLILLPPALGIIFYSWRTRAFEKGPGSKLRNEGQGRVTSSFNESIATCIST